MNAGRWGPISKDAHRAAPTYPVTPLVCDYSRRTCESYDTIHCVKFKTNRNIMIDTCMTSGPALSCRFSQHTHGSNARTPESKQVGEHYLRAL